MKKFKYFDYAKARDASWRVISEYGISSLPVDVFELAHKMGIKTIPYGKCGPLLKMMGIRSLYGKSDGIYVSFFGKKYIFYDDLVTNEGRLRFTIAHEIGHHVLRHISSMHTLYAGLKQRRRDGHSDAEEREANIFASRLLAPSIVLHKMNITDAEDIARICGMSKEAAGYRARRMAELNSRDKFCISKLEQCAAEKFEDFIKNNSSSDK